MSRRSRKNRFSRKQTKPHKEEKSPLGKQQGKKQIMVFALIAVLAAIPFSMGKYFEFNSPGPYDSGANVYSAKHILEGAKIGVEEKHSAMVGTLLVNIVGVWLFGFNDIGPNFMQMLLQAAAIILMFIAMWKLYGKLAAAVGAIITSIYLSAPLIAKFGNDKTQFMVTFMVLGMSCFVLWQLGGKWWWAVLAGGFLSWAPLFKPVGTSAIGGVGLFVVLQPLLKNRTWKQTGIDILLLLAGAAAAIGPLYLWIIGWEVQMTLPYSFVWRTLGKILPAGGGPEQAKVASDYVSRGRKLVPFSVQWPRVLRFYGLFVLPIALAVGSIIARIAKLFLGWLNTSAERADVAYDRFVILFAVWWILDMAFVWISPRSYEQYYLPLNASAAMLGGYLIALYRDRFKSTIYKTRWLITGLVGLLLMVIMSWHIFFGIETSPHSGQKYGGKRKGYAQSLKEISLRRKKNLKFPWEVTGEYIRDNSAPTDKIYVWGWYPGIYVKAQRFSSSPKAFMMPRQAPEKLKNDIAELLAILERDRSKFIVDPRKRHIPTERPPYELWPISGVPKQFMGPIRPFLALDKNITAAYDKMYSNYLRSKFDEDEALRYEALKPFREFVMKNYEVVEPVRRFWPHVVFRLKKTTSN